jgi:hypothetical protein
MAGGEPDGEQTDCQVMSQMEEQTDWQVVSQMEE